MSVEFRDVAIIVDGGDPITDSVHAGIGLRLSAHYGARLTVFEQAADVTIDRSSWLKVRDEVPFAGIQICGASNDASLRHEPRPPMDALLRETRQNGRWMRRPDRDDLLEHLRCMDLIVVGCPISSDSKVAPNVVEIIAQAGRPALVVPRKFAQRRLEDRKIGHRVLVAWNASAESARAVHDGLPFLRRAEEVTLLFVNEGRKRNDAQHLVASIADHLGRHGISARSEVIPTKDIPPSQLIVDRLDELDANLLVMGAFSRSPLREAWFGGASDDLLHAITVPILASH